MINRFCKMPLWEANRTLIEVAQGKRPAETVIKDAKLIDVCTAEIVEHVDVAISCGRIAYVGIEPYTAEHTIGPDTHIIEANGRYLSPGFIDGHMHIESSMITPSEYARATAPHGTCAVAADPHEIANVCGMPGVDAMIRDAQRVPLKIMITTPSCVPAVPGFEHSGSELYAKDIEASMQLKDVVGLGEMMNFPGILNCDDNPIEEVNATLRSGACVTGHYSIPEHDRGLNAYIASGVSCCHESITPEDVLAKIRLGMYVQLREGSAWHNLRTLAPAIVGKKIDARYCCMVSDDNHPHTLVAEGHLDRILQIAVEEGIDPVIAIQMVTINAATCFGLQHEMGVVGPGKCADLILLDELESFKVSLTMIDGEVVYEDGQNLFDVDPLSWPDSITHTMHVATQITPDTFKIAAPSSNLTSIKVNVMEMAGGHVDNKHRVLEIPVVDGFVQNDPVQDVLKVGVFERHHDTGNFALGFTKGFGIHGALAQTVSHDAHNLLVMGDNDEDMAIAANRLIEIGGGEVAVMDGEILGEVDLPIAGLMSPERVEIVSAKVEKIESAWEKMGCKMPSPFMTLGLMSLACIPDLRLTDMGYVNTLTFQFEDIFVE